MQNEVIAFGPFRIEARMGRFDLWAATVDTGGLRYLSWYTTQRKAEEAAIQYTIDNPKEVKLYRV